MQALLSRIALIHRHSRRFVAKIEQGGAQLAQFGPLLRQAIDFGTIDWRVIAFGWSRFRGTQDFP